MAADLHLYVMPFADYDNNLTLLKALHSNALGSAWFNPVAFSGHNPNPEINDTGYTHNQVIDTIVECPDVWIGEVSWLKAGLFEDKESYVPPVVEQVSDLIDSDYPVPITQELIDKICSVIDSAPANPTNYAVVESSQTVRELLEPRIGGYLSSMSW